MPSLEKSRLIVLHLTKYADSSLVLHTVDSQYGRRSLLVRGVRKNRGALAAFHNLSLLDAVSAASPKSSLSYLREWEPSATLHGIRGDRIKGAVAMFISEVLYRSLTNEQTDPQLFDWLWEMAQKLDAEEGSVANFPLWFLVSYAGRMGFLPGDPIEPPGLFNPFESDLLFRVVRSSYSETMAIPLSADRRQAFSRQMLQYLSYHLGATIDAKSLDVLHAVLA